MPEASSPEPQSVILTGEYVPENLLSFSADESRLRPRRFRRRHDPDRDYDLMGPSAFMTMGELASSPPSPRGFGYGKPDIMARSGAA